MFTKLRRALGIDKPKTWAEAVEWEFGNKEPDLSYLAKMIDEHDADVAANRGTALSATYRVHMIGVRSNVRRALAFGVSQ